MVMTKEEQNWYKKGKNYSDNFFKNFRVRQVLKKIKDEEESGTKAAFTSRQQLLKDYGDWVNELESTRVRLARFPILLSSYHPSIEKRGISRVSQFIYHIENYLSVIYIFDQRVKRFVRTIEKSAKKQGCPAPDIESLVLAKESLIKSVEPLVKIRGNHTHDKYLKDNEIKEMEKYDRAGDFSDNLRDRKFFKSQAKLLLSEQRKRWKKDMLGDLEKYEIQLGILYSALDKVVWQIYRKT